MCGLVLVITKRSNGFTNYQKEMFDELLFIDTFRGEDSTGVFVVDTIGNVKLAKSAEHAPSFMLTKEYSELRSKAFQSGWAMIGHNRKATRGTITDENAHPFVVDDNIVLVHNGSFNGGHQHIAKTNVDSEAIAHALYEEEDPEIALRRINAAFALMWYNVAKKQINVVRNLMRPLFYFETPDEIVFASEKCFLDFVISKHNLKPMDNGPHPLKEYMLVTYSLTEGKTLKEDLRELDCSYWKHNAPESGASGRSFQGDPTDSEEEYYRKLRQQNAYACGWGGLDDDSAAWQDVSFKEKPKPGKEVIVLQPPDPPLQSVNITDATDRGMVNRVLQGIYPKQTKMTYADWFKIKDTYVNKQRIKVTVNDMVEADDDQATENFLMIGRPLDNPKVYVAFRLKAENFEEVAKMASSADAVFEVEVDNCIWRRTDAYLPEDKRTIEEFEGVTIVKARNPTPIYVKDQRVVH